jgi:putative membrane protein
MAFSEKTSIIAVIALTGLIGCGGSDQNTPPQTPASATTDTTMTTGASTQGTSTAAPSTQDTSGMSGTSGATGQGTGQQGTWGNPGQGQGSLGTAGGMGGTGAPSSGAGGVGGATSDTSSALTDAQIAAVTNAANTAEVDQGKEAVKKAKNGKVKTFAQHMIADHGAAFKQQTDVERTANITPIDNEMSRQVLSDGKTILSQLQSAPGGADFDKQYMDAQVREHQQVLDTLDNKLIPNAKNGDLKAFLQKIRDKVADHLKQAKDIQGSLK